MSTLPVHAGVRVPKVAVLIIIAFLCFAPQFYFGFIGGGLLTPLGWSLGMAMFAVGTGWRAPEKNIATSVLIGTCYAAAANVPIYLIGRWFGDPASGSIAFTAIASVLGLLAFGSLTVLRRVWPKQLADDKLPSSTEKSRAAPEVKDVFSKLHRLMDSEKAQNERLPEPYRSQVLHGADCDEIAQAVGEFGRDPRNPIPVNGSLGEMIYLSNLRTADSQQIMFHRLGSISNVDIYETVSLDGAMWDILFLHQYHPRKSRRAPPGYHIVIGTERNSLLLGVNEFVAAFPDRLSDAIAGMSERIFKFRIRPSQVREALARAIFKRPLDHRTRLDVILTVLQQQA
jgi:hypothetical protein